MCCDPANASTLKCWPSAAQHGETHCVERHGTDAMAAAQAQQESEAQ
jgi:hypothetical protein